MAPSTFDYPQPPATAAIVHSGSGPSQTSPNGRSPPANSPDVDPQYHLLDAVCLRAAANVIRTCIQCVVQHSLTDWGKTTRLADPCSDRHERHSGDHTSPLATMPRHATAAIFRFACHMGRRRPCHCHLLTTCASRFQTLSAPANE